MQPGRSAYQPIRAISPAGGLDRWPSRSALNEVISRLSPAVKDAGSSSQGKTAVQGWTGHGDVRGKLWLLPAVFGCGMVSSFAAAYTSTGTRRAGYLPRRR